MNLFGRAANRIVSLVVKGLIEHVVDSDEMQIVKISTTADEVIEGVERVQPYGLSTVPPKGSEAIALFLNGDKQQGIVITCDSAANRPKGLSTNDVALYSAHGQQITMDSSGDTLVDNGSDFVAMAAKVDAFIQAFDTMMRAWVPTPPATVDNGASLQTAYLAAFSPPPELTASTNLKAD